MNNNKTDNKFFSIFVSIVVVTSLLVAILLGLKSQAYNKRKAEDEKMLRAVTSDIHVEKSLEPEDIVVKVAVNPDMNDASKKARCTQIERGIKNALTEEGIGIASDKESSENIFLTVYIDEDKDINSENIYAIYNAGFFSNRVSNSQLADVMERYTAAASGMNPAGIFDSDGNSKSIEYCETPAVLMLVSFPQDVDIKLTVNGLAKGMAQGIITVINETGKE